MGVDSHEYPARNYGDLAFRSYGTTARYIVNFLQSIGLLLLLGQVVILFGQNISEMSRYSICYVVCPLIFTVIGFVLSQIRSLRNFGWIANFSFWMNILAIFISMGAVAHNPPNFAIATLGSVGGKSTTARRAHLRYADYDRHNRSRDYHASERYLSCDRALRRASLEQSRRYH